MSDIYIGMMSGTSLDGVDAIAAQFPANGPPIILAEAYSPFEPLLRAALLELQHPSENEIDKEARAANALVLCYAQVVHTLLESLPNVAHKDSPSNRPHPTIRAIGVHGQTIRHCPKLGYSRQINNPALLAELTHIDVIADFRSRDIAAGGQGAPLVPAFHAKLLGASEHVRAVCNIGGISNITILSANGEIRGWDCGPGNVLMDYWASRHTDRNYDDRGQLAAQGRIHHPLLEYLLEDPYFQLPPPKSTGRDVFHPAWLERGLAKFANYSPADIQATLTALTAHCIAQDLLRHASECESIYVCGGGERNPVLLKALADAVKTLNLKVRVRSTMDVGIPAHQMEALTFAWLAMRFTQREAGNLPRVTGAAGPRVLGALYPF